MTDSALPLFYRDPRPLSSVEHADWRLVDGDASFAATTAFAPVVAGELAAAARHYPIVFVGGEGAPVAVLGLEHVNLFVADGAWDEGAYVPAYVRRYPFGFIPAGDDRFALGIDAASDRVARGGAEGAALFDNGEPTAETRQALAFCEAFHAEAAATMAFAAALKEQDLLVDRRADVTLPDGRTMGLDGFQIVDAERLGALPDAVVVDWHRRGLLALAYHHLASLNHFQDLLARQARRAGATASPLERLDA